MASRFRFRSSNNNEDNESNETTSTIIYFIVYGLLALWAVYLSFKRNRGFHLGSFIMAICFAPFYIFYAKFF